MSGEVREFKELLFIIFHAFEENERDRVPMEVKKRFIELAEKLFSDPLYRDMARRVASMFVEGKRFYWMVAHLLFAVDGIGH